MARKYSSEYKNLQPYVVEDIRKVVNAAGVSTGGSGGSLEQHALDSWYHTGQLAQSQASWAATKVELSNHAALPDAHHAKLHGITDAANHSVTGSQYQIVGLTAVNTIGLLTPSASPAANAIIKTDGSSAVTLVDLTVTSDLFMSGYLDFGTDTMYEDASYLQVTGSKAVRFSQNIGNANWTVYNAGGASFGGSVDIINGGDLTVIGSGSYAGNKVLFADSSGGNVGIMMNPDSQFALDINGPARATYWIGPHALQLKDVLLLAHFDGRAPYETNYSGETNGHMGQVGTVNGGLIFRPGKFYKAAQIADATTNLITNPSFETGITGWTGYSSGTVAHSGVRSLYGVNCLLVTIASNGQGVQASKTGLSASTAYTLSVYVYSTTARSISLHATDDSDKDHGTTTVAVTASTWTRLSLSFTTDSHTGVYWQITANGSTNLYVDGAQLEAGATATPFCDGSLGGYDVNGVPDGSAHAWTGTANASTSTRTAGRLAYAQPGNVDSSVGTLSMWVNFASVANYRYIMAASSNGGLAVYAGATTLSVARVNTQTITNTTVTWTPETWYHIAVTWSGTAVTVYRNGTQIDTGTAGAGFVTPASYYIGRSFEGTYFLNGLIDDLCILGRAADADEIRAIYESNAPVFAETSTFNFRPTPKGLIWADDEGLWMRDTVGNPVLGVYGGESTKSWGGFTMAPGDLLIGNNAVGSSAIMWDQSAGTFGFYGAGSATAQASVATDGAITAGAGAVALNSSGIQITAPSSQSAIGSYKFYVTGKTITSGLSAYYNSGADTYYTGVWSNSSNIGNITTGIDATIGGGGTVKILFGLTNSLGTTSTVYTLSGGNVATLWIGSGGTNYVGIGTAAAPTRAFQVNGGVFAGGDNTGLAGYVQLTNSTQGVSSGNGTVKMNGGTARDSVGWLKLYSGTTAIYVPYWTTVTG